MQDFRVMDGNEAAADVAYRLSEVIAIYPITPATAMGEGSDAWQAVGRPNLWGAVPRVVEMQSEGGAAGAVHGALQAGALATTFTSSQGLLLMLPNMYKIAGELSSAVIHVAARAVATHALSIFGDHSDVMAARTTGFAILFSASVQEAADMALAAHAVTLQARVPVLHAFDGFRTSHELATILPISDEQVRATIDDAWVAAHRARGLSPDHPVVRGTAQNPDVFFQAREASNPYYAAVPGIVRATFARLGAACGRSYDLYEYAGHPEAERVIVVMGSATETAMETARALAAAGERVGVVRVRLFRPFAVGDFVAALPATTRAIAVLDRCKEPGAPGEPLYQDVVAAVAAAVRDGEAPFEAAPRVYGGRYGLASKDFTPAMARAVFDELARPRPRHPFTVGIVDDLGDTSLAIDDHFELEPAETTRAIFWGLGADGTVGANKNTIEIIGALPGMHAQAYFIYDSKKSGARTISHLRFGPHPIRCPYPVHQANFVAVHQFDFLTRLPVLDAAGPGATLLLNSPYGPEEVWEHLPAPIQAQVLARGLRLFVVDAARVAREAGLRGRINTVMQACFFELAGVLPEEEAIAKIKAAVTETYGKRGEAVVRQNHAAVDAAIAHLHEVPLAGRQVAGAPLPPPVAAEAPPQVRSVVGPLLAERGDALPVSAMAADGTFPTGTSRWEKRNLATSIPTWDPDLCIQCGKCVVICPHASIRAKVYPPEASAAAPASFQYAAAMGKAWAGQRYALAVAVEDCTGCELCVEVCPAKDRAEPTRRALAMAPQRPLREAGRASWDHFLALPDAPPAPAEIRTARDLQVVQPRFEFSGACAGCGETPYLKLLSQLFGDRAVIANATGCSSIYGANLPTTPWTTDAAGRGPAWSNSLFEDNAEFGLGMRLALDQQAAYADRLLSESRERVGEDLADALQGFSLATGDLAAQRAHIAELRARLTDGGATPPAELAEHAPRLRDLYALAEHFVPRAVWIVGGDGWAYDIGFGGLDHVLSGRDDVNVLVLDTEVYSNTGGQASKATPRGAVAKFASGGKAGAKKDLGLMAMDYGHVYVARVALGANEAQTIRAFQEAAAYPGPSLIVAYSPCIAHGIEMSQGPRHQQLAVDTGYWPLYRFDPRRRDQGEPALQLDSKAPRLPVGEFLSTEGRFAQLLQRDPATAQAYLAAAQQDVDARWGRYARLAEAGRPC